MGYQSFLRGCAPPLISEANFPSDEGGMSNFLVLDHCGTTGYWHGNQRYPEDSARTSIRAFPHCPAVYHVHEQTGSTPATFKTEITSQTTYRSFRSSSIRFYSWLSLSYQEKRAIDTTSALGSPHPWYSSQSPSPFLWEPSQTSAIMQSLRTT
jgi:hypothetical protein